MSITLELKKKSLSPLFALFKTLCFRTFLHYRCFQYLGELLSLSALGLAHCCVVSILEFHYNAERCWSFLYCREDQEGDVLGGDEAPQRCNPKVVSANSAGNAKDSNCFCVSVSFTVCFDSLAWWSSTNWSVRDVECEPGSLDCKTLGYIALIVCTLHASAQRRFLLC